MDPVNIEKIQAVHKYKKHQLLNNVFLYFLTAVACSLFCSSPFWYPSLCSSMNVFLFVTLPKLGSLFLSSKFLFLVGNLIVIILIGGSKSFPSDSSLVGNLYYDEYINRIQSLRSCHAVEDKKERKLEMSLEEEVKKIICEDGEHIERKSWGEEKIEVGKEREDLDGEEELTDELNKRADDFIARVNKQRRLEAKLQVCSNE